MTANKFHARKVTIDGHEFPSIAEGNRYTQLKWLERARDIQALAIQPRYPLVVNGVTVGVYTADFAYMTGGRKITEDVKGGPLRAADSLRMRVFMACYPELELLIVDRKGGTKPFKQRKVAPASRPASAARAA